MGKLGTYIGIMAGLILVLNIFGFIPNTFSGAIMTALFDPTNIQNLSLGALITTAFGIGAGLATAVGVAFKNDLMVFAGVGGILLTFLYEFIAVILIMQRIIGVFALIIVAPLTILYLLSVLEWWRGTATT